MPQALFANSTTGLSVEWRRLERFHFDSCLSYSCFYFEISVAQCFRALRLILIFVAHDSFHIVTKRKFLAEWPSSLNCLHPLIRLSFLNLLLRHCSSQN